MSALLISYDLNSPGQDYEEVHHAIRGLGSAVGHPLESTWIVITSMTPELAYRALKPSFDQNDNFLIVDITRAPRQGWLRQKSWDWINKNL